MNTNITRQQNLFAQLMKDDDQKSFEQYADKKRKLFNGLSGDILEIGPGTGVNFAFYPKHCRWQGIETNRAMIPFLKDAARLNGFNDINVICPSKKELPIADNSQDHVISTLVLCSVPSVKEYLTEILRILKPGGSFVFIEHVVDHNHIGRKLIQKTVPFTPWRYFSDGCNPGRDILADINTAGFSKVESKQYLQEGPGLILAVNRPHIYGIATK